MNHFNIINIIYKINFIIKKIILFHIKIML